jgi:hypothetical protein
LLSGGLIGRRIIVRDELGFVGTFVYWLGMLVNAR